MEVEGWEVDDEGVMVAVVEVVEMAQVGLRKALAPTAVSSW